MSRAKNLPTITCYFGVPFSLARAESVMARAGFYGVIESLRPDDVKPGWRDDRVPKSNEIPALVST